MWPPLEESVLAVRTPGPDDAPSSSATTTSVQLTRASSAAGVASRWAWWAVLLGGAG